MVSDLCFHLRDVQYIIVNEKTTATCGKLCEGMSGEWLENIGTLKIRRVGFFFFFAQTV